MIRFGCFVLLVWWMSGVCFAQPTPTVYTGKYSKSRQPWAVLRTSKGNVLIRLLEAQAPRTVAHFIGLARGTTRWKHPKTGKWSNTPFYNGLKFHRILKGFLVQTGCPLSKGTHGPGFRVKQEWNPLLKHNRIGTVSMQTMKKGLLGSQFFVTIRPMPWLDYRSIRLKTCSNFKRTVRCVRNADCQKYASSFPGQSSGRGKCVVKRRYRGTTMFGRVERGMEVIRAIEQLPIGPTGGPQKPAAIISIDIYRARRWKQSWLRSFRPERPSADMFRNPSR